MDINQRVGADAHLNMIVEIVSSISRPGCRFLLSNSKTHPHHEYGRNHHGRIDDKDEQRHREHE
jgi:hypothetical protein